MILMCLAHAALAADISVSDATSLDRWARRQLAWMVDESDTAQLSAKSNAVIAASTYEQGVRLAAGTRALLNARQWGVSTEDERLWAAAGLSTDESVRQRALLGSQVGAVRWSAGDLAVPDEEALARWMELRAEVVWVDWWLQAKADNAVWRSGRPGETDLEDPRVAKTWTVRVGYRLENSGEALAETLGVPSDCRDRIVTWETTHTATAVIYSGDGMGIGVATVPVPRSAEVPERPDQCMSRDQVLEPVATYNERLQASLGLADFELGGAPVGTPPQTFRPVVDPTVFRDDLEDG